MKTIYCVTALLVLCVPASAITNEELVARGCPLSAMRSPVIETAHNGFVVHIGSTAVNVAANSNAVTTPYEARGRAGAVMAQRGMVWLDPVDATPDTHFSIKCLVPPMAKPKE